MSDSNQEPQEVERAEEREDDGGFWWWVKPVLIAVACTLFIRVFVAELFTVPTGSMEDTIMPGDMVFTEKVTPHFTDPKPGEVVVFNNPQGDGTVLVKRVIAVAGQTVDMSAGRVLVDGVALDEPYTLGRPSEPLASQMPGLPELIYPLTVPEGCIWVMGDNRTNSRDSRYFGFVETNEVFGHGLCVVWPPADWRAL